MRILCLLIGLGIWSSVLGDVIIRRDGTRLEGSIKKIESGWQVTSADGKVTQVPASDVKSIELGSRAPATQAASADLASLRRSVEALNDLGQIIERYERFIGITKDPTIVEEAKKDLAAWQDRQARGLVKQGGNWVTPEEADKLREGALGLAENAREMLRLGRIGEAESAIQQALAADPANPAALYLRGVMLYRADKLVDSRKAFESSNAGVPSHAPILNNLAVILWRQNAQGGALNFYDQAMQAQPVNKFILDNVAEALGTMPEDMRKGQATQRVVRRFTEQDTILQKQLAPQGWYRWGSTWVDQKQLDELKAAEKEINDKVAKLDEEYKNNERRLVEIDERIASNERAMWDLESRSVWRDRDGKIHRYPLPSYYYDLKRENENLRIEQQSIQRRFGELREAARRTRQQLPAPRFTGVMQIVGVEGTPLLAPPAAPPATAPSETSMSR